MPFINVKTNIPVSENAQEALKTRLGAGHRGHSRQKRGLADGGRGARVRAVVPGHRRPAALVEVSVYGGAEPDAYDALTARVCELLDAVLDIDPARVYVKYAETPNWGWNGGNF